MDIVYEFESDVRKSLNALCGNLKGKKILVALSGGADSVCLLRVLCALSKSMQFGVFALHVNHMIRGEEADRDEQFCVKLCKTQRVKLAVFCEDIPSLAKKCGESLELCARNYRYSVFEKHCAENGIDFIATAHNANDNAETVLYNIIRGTGIDGLCGVPCRRDNIIRPILDKTREEILAYLSALESDYVIDSTNNENDYSRNYIRNVLIPAAKRINPAVISSLNRLSDVAEEDNTYFENEVNAFFEKDNQPLKLKGLPVSLQKRVVRRMFQQRFGTALENKHIVSICNGLAVDAEKCVCLPNNVNAVTHNGTLTFYDSTKPQPRLMETVLRLGENYVAGLFVKVEVSYGPFRAEVNIPERYMFSVSLDKENIKGKLCVRPRKTGDCITVRNINRNVKKCFINNKVPVSVRDKVPIIYDDEGIVYVPFIGVADRVYTKKGKEACNISVVLSERVGQR